MLQISKNFLERVFSSIVLIIFMLILEKKIHFFMLFLSFLMLFEVFFAINLANFSVFKKVILMWISLFILLVFIYFVLEKKSLFEFIISTFILDTGSYIGGNIMKSPKITSISPKKTLAGYMIGLICGSIAYYKLVKTHFFLSMIIAFLAVLGDFLVSCLKRELKIKDFSRIIPGHGGVLDRFDSLCLSYIFYNILL